MIKKFDTLAAYAAAGQPNESRVSVIAENGELFVDCVNVLTKVPQLGDAAYKKDGKIYYFKGGDALRHESLAALGFSDLGQTAGWIDGEISYLDKAIQSSTKYLDVCQYAITAIASTTIQLKLRMSPDYAVDTLVDVTLEDTQISEANASAISAAVAAKATEVGDTKAWWAYLDAANDRIIVQCDTCVDYRFYTVGATGCTIAHVTWEDMPANSAYYKSNGRSTNYRGMMNIARASSYWSTNGRAEAGANDVWHGALGINDNPLQRSVFLTTAMFGSGRHQYPTYEDYLRGEFGIMPQQKYGCFNLPSGKELTGKYGNMAAPTKDGGTKYKYPALHFPCTIDRGVDGLRAGDLFLTGIREGVTMMDDENMARINATRRKMGHTLISNGSTRWFAQRYNVYFAWLFNGNNGTLNDDTVNYGNQVQGAALLKP